MNVQEQGQNIVYESKDGKLYDLLREREIKIENDIKLYGEYANTEQIYEDQEIEATLWESVEG